MDAANPLETAGPGRLAHPDPALARRLRAGAGARLIDSLAYCLERAEAVLCPGNGVTPEAIAAARAHLDTVRQRGEGVSPIAFALHAELLHAMRSGDAPGAAGLVNGFARYRLLPLSSARTLAPWPGDPELGEHERALLKTLITREYKSTYNREFDAVRPAPGDLARSREAAARVDSALADCAPDLAAEIQAVTDLRMSIDSAHINAGSNFYSLGMIYINVLRPEQDWTVYIEQIVHEAAHNYLFHVWATAPILTSDPGGLHSPVRAELRPLSGLFHAMFVLGRVVWAARLIERSGRWNMRLEDMATNYNNAKNDQPFIAKFDSAAREIDRHRDALTETGAALLDDTRALVDAVRQPGE